MIPKPVKFLLCIPFVIIICYLAYLLSRYSSIPDTIPIHGYSKNTDGYGSKAFLFFPIILNLVMLGVIWMMIRRPDKMNFSFEMKEEEKAKVGFTLQIVLAIIAIFLTVFTTVLLFSDVVF